jgi:outer membrane lipoprotein-sorting protein
MRWRRIGIVLVVFSSSLLFSCQKAPADPTAKPQAKISVETPTGYASSEAPFATKEPEKYSAKIVFSFRYDEAAANFIEQTYFVARDGNNRRLDFQSGERDFTRIQSGDGKQFVLLNKQKVYAELNAPDGNLSIKGDEKGVINQPDDFSLQNLLNTKPFGASFERVGEEEILNRKTTKYRLDFGAVAEAENARTETFVWADENLGLPVRTEVTALENGSATGARNITELREIKMEVDPKTFEIPKGFRKISFEEIRQILRK